METAFKLLVRTLLIIIGAVLLVLGAGFFFGYPGALTLWPWPDDGVSYVFIASILAAIGAPVLWIGLSGELAAMRGGALGFIVICTGIAVTLLLFGTSLAETISIKLFLTVVSALALFNMFLFLAASNTQFQDQRPVPWFLRAAFLLLFLALAGIGIALIMGYQEIFPWPLKSQSSVVFGCAFLGAATYFLYGYIKPVLGNVKGQLIGLLTHGLVLLAPFLQHINIVKLEHQLSLYIYSAAIICGALLSLYFLLLHSSTRFGSEDFMYIDDAF